MRRIAILAAVLVLPCLGLVAADAAAPAAAAAAPPERGSRGISLRIEASVLPGIDRVEIGTTDLEQEGMVMVPAVGITFTDPMASFAGVAVEGTGEGGIGAQLLVVARTPGPVGLAVRGGPFARVHGGGVTERVLTGSAMSVAMNTTPAVAIVGPTSPFLPGGWYEVETSGYGALGVGFGAALAVTTGPVQIEVGPFLDLGVGSGLGTSVEDYTTLAIPFARGDLDEVDTTVKAGGYIAYGGGLDVMVALPRGLRVGGGLFWLRGEGRDRVEIDSEPYAVIFTAPIGFGYYDAHLEYGRSFDFAGFGGKLIFGLAF